MLLLAVAVVFIFLGAREATRGDDSPADDLKAAGNSQPAATTPAEGATTSAAPSSSKPDVEGVPSMCVLNAGTVTGLAGDVSEALKAAGFDVSATENLQTSSISENTVFYGPGEQEAAEKVAAAVPGGASADPRPAAFTRCSGELAVIVVTQ